MPRNAPIACLAFAAALLLAAATGLPAQELIMKDGQRKAALGASRRGDKIFVTVAVGTGQGQVAYDLGQIDTVKLPPSPELDSARALLADDQGTEVLKVIDSAARPAEAFRGLGEDRWGEAMLIKAAAYMALDMQQKARETLNTIVVNDAGTEAARVAKIRLAIGADANPKKAAEMLQLADTELAETNPAAVRSAATLLKAKVLLDNEDYENALMAALAVTIFFAEERIDVSRAELIAGECYLNLDDKPRAVRSYHDVVTGFPKTPAAVFAQKQIDKGGEPFKLIVDSLEAQEKENKARLQSNQADAPASDTKQPAATPTPAP